MEISFLKLFLQVIVFLKRDNKTRFFSLKGDNKGMTKMNQIYRCAVCGNIVEVIHTGAGQLVCCGQPMELLIAKDKDIGFEKHVPIIDKTETGVNVVVGSIPHPMEESHYIEFIEIIADGKVCRKFLKPGDKPIVSFEIKADKIEVIAYCNVHGLWQSN